MGSELLRATLMLQPEQAAQRLLGWRLAHTTDEGTVEVALTEVEAYAGDADPASHAFRGPTPRNQVMFGPAGFSYVYFSYGMHWCLNVVTGPTGSACAVLLRAGRVTRGHDLARARRGPRTPDRSLARGPACLTQALAVGRAQHGLDLVSGEGGLQLTGCEPVESELVSAGPRVGVSAASEVPWRFWLTDDPTVSAYRRSARAGSR